MASLQYTGLATHAPTHLPQMLAGATDWMKPTRFTRNTLVSHGMCVNRFYCHINISLLKSINRCQVTHAQYSRMTFPIRTVHRKMTPIWYYWRSVQRRLLAALCDNHYNTIETITAESQPSSPRSAIKVSYF